MSDDLIWQVINKQFCSFQIRPHQSQNNQDFCRNEYNVTGLCDRRSCPLANSQYATIKQVDGKIYLYMKTVERSHTPKNLWQRIRLSKNYQTALNQINENLLYWSDFNIMKCKQRFTRLKQIAINERRMALREERGDISERSYVGVKHKVKKREEKRERKALASARIEKAIERELLDRLKSGAYGDNPLNVDNKIWKKVLGKIDSNNQQEKENEFEDEEDFDSANDDIQLDSDDENDQGGQIEYVEDIDDDEEDEMVDMEDLEKWLGNDSDESDDDLESESENDAEETDQPKRKKIKTKRARIEVEYEDEPITNIATN